MNWLFQVQSIIGHTHFLFMFNNIWVFVIIVKINYILTQVWIKKKKTALHMSFLGMLSEDACSPQIAMPLHC